MGIHVPCHGWFGGVSVAGKIGHDNAEIGREQMGERAHMGHGTAPTVEKKDCRASILSENLDWQST